MSEAVAKITLDSSGASQGAKQFERAAELVFNADKKIKDQIEKPAKAGKGLNKARTDAAALTGDLSKLTTATGALDVAMSRFGKAAGAVGVFAVLGKTIYDAKEEAREFENLMRKIGTMNVGSVTGRSLSELEGNVSTIQGERDANQKKMTSLPEAIQTKINAYFGNLFDVVTTGKTKTSSELDSVGEDRDERLGQQLARAKDRVLKKDEEITAVMEKRIKGNEQENALLDIQLKYREKIQKAMDAKMDGRIPELEKQQAIEEQNLKNRSDTAWETRGRNVAVASDELRQAENRLSMSPEAAERERRLNAAWLAGGEKGDGGLIADARLESGRNPENEDLKAKVTIAEKAYRTILADNAVWERDILRAKEDSLRAATATGDEIDAQNRGMSNLADQVKQRASAEQSITSALRAGNTELAAQLAKADQVLSKQKAIQTLTDPNTGRERPIGQIRREQRAKQRAADRSERAYDRRAEDDFLVGMTRDSGGKVTGGTDILTGEKVKYGKDGLLYGVNGKLSSRYDRVRDNDDHNYAIGTDGKWNWLSADSGEPWQDTKRNHDQQKSQQEAKERGEKKAKDSGQDSPQSLLKSMASDMTRTREIVEEWNRD